MWFPCQPLVGNWQEVWGDDWVHMAVTLQCAGVGLRSEGSVWGCWWAEGTHLPPCCCSSRATCARTGPPAARRPLPRCRRAGAPTSRCSWPVGRHGTGRLPGKLSPTPPKSFTLQPCLMTTNHPTRLGAICQKAVRRKSIGQKRSVKSLKMGQRVLEKPRRRT